MDSVSVMPRRIRNSNGDTRRVQVEIDTSLNYALPQIATSTAAAATRAGGVIQIFVTASSGARHSRDGRQSWMSICVYTAMR